MSTRLQTRTLSKCLPKLDSFSILLCTPNTLPQKVEKVGTIAVVDAVPTPNGFSKTGYSLLRSPALRVSASEDAILRFCFASGEQLSLTPANTIFENGCDSSIFINGDQARGLEVNLDRRLSSSALHLPLRAITREHRITQCRGNIISSLDDMPASRILVEALDPSKVQGVFAMIGERVVKVIAGGGEWSAKAALLALDDDFSPQQGAYVSFLVTDNERTRADDGIVFMGENEQFDESPGEQALLNLPLFGAVSRKGLYADYWCKVPGAKLIMKIAQ